LTLSARAAALFGGNALRGGFLRPWTFVPDTRPARSSHEMSGASRDTLPDDELLARFQRDASGAGGRQAAGELLGRYRGRVYTWCYRMVGNNDQALDLAQDVLVKAWRALPGFAGRSRFSSWLFSIARNECLTALRPKSLRQDPHVDPVELLVEHEDPPALHVTREEENAMDILLRETLSPLEQEAIWLRCFERLPVGEVTRLLGLTHASGARSVLQSARTKLRAALARRRSGA
jgi:RNA polymerase sigma-70 factor (ECF subfamily)